MKPNISARLTPKLQLSLNLLQSQLLIFFTIQLLVHFVL